MAAYYGTEQIERLKRSVDIVSLIESYVPLQRAGRLMKACCPFHDEKSPSFVVYADDQRYHCFGGTCGKGGDALHFIMEIEKLSFPEAVEQLADRVGFTLVAEKGTGGEAPRSQKKDLYSANKFTMEFYHQALMTPPGQAALAYLRGRGITDEMIKRFGLGFAGTGLAQAVRKAKLDLDPFTKAGLLLQGGNPPGLYEPFRGRVMFPIRDVQGRITGFGGRILEKAEASKYINSPATPVFNKRENLYGIDLVKEIHAKDFPLVIVEGYTDVIGLYQHGFRGAVATLGTALTPEHLRQLRRFTDHFIMLFDADAAGINAAEKTIDLFAAEDIEVAFVTLPEGKDPFDFVTARGLEPFQGVLAAAVSMYAFKKRLLEARNGGATLTARSRIIQELVRSFTRLPSPVKRDLVLRQISADFSVSIDALTAMTARDAAAERPAPPRAEPPAPPVDPLGSASEETILKACFAFPVLFAAAYDQVGPQHFNDPALRTIFAAGVEQFEEDRSFDPVRALGRLQDPGLAGRASRYLYEPMTGGEQAAIANREGIRHLLLRHFEAEEARLRQEYIRAEQSGDEEQARKAFVLLDTIQKQKHALV
ncbi:MAG: DNA primase [Planctomycetota bacterium]